MTILGQCDTPRRPDCSLISQASPFADEACETINHLLKKYLRLGRGTDSGVYINTHVLRGIGCSEIGSKAIFVSKCL